ncbi:hypothetical protein D3C75_845840 [compost metagenome]
MAVAQCRCIGHDGHEGFLGCAKVVAEHNQSDALVHIGGNQLERNMGRCFTHWGEEAFQKNGFASVGRQTAARLHPGLKHLGGQGLVGPGYLVVIDAQQGKLIAEGHDIIAEQWRVDVAVRISIWRSLYVRVVLEHLHQLGEGKPVLTSLIAQ